MRTAVIGIAAALLLASPGTASRASDTIGFFGLIEKVVFEPDSGAPDRVQLWGACAYANVSPQSAAASRARRGYLHFRLPSPASAASVNTVRTEWRDLASLAGTGQAVGFGSWAYIRAFPTEPSARPQLWMGLVEGGPSMDLRVRPASEAPAAPAVYATNIGIVNSPPTDLTRMSSPR
jgi:hypothetical protein